MCVAADARDEGAYARALDGDKARLLLTDPPYCLLTRRRRDGKPMDLRAHKKIDRERVVRFESVRDYRRFCEEWVPAATAHLTPDAMAILWTNFLGKEPLLAAARAT